MRYTAEHNETARNRLLERGGRHAKKHGFAGSGMDALAAAAGVTTGSVYKHFDGKADLFASLIRAELERTARTFSTIPPGDAEAARKLLAGYLSMQHVSHPGGGCVLPALTPEVARGDDAARDAFRSGLVAIHAIVADRITGSDEQAWALIAQCVGAVMLARAVGDPAVGRRLLAAVKATCEEWLERPADSAVRD